MKTCRLNASDVAARPVGVKPGDGIDWKWKILYVLPNRKHFSGSSWCGRELMCTFYDVSDHGAHGRDLT